MNVKTDKFHQVLRNTHPPDLSILFDTDYNHPLRPLYLWNMSIEKACTLSMFTIHAQVSWAKVIARLEHWIGLLLHAKQTSWLAEHCLRDELWKHWQLYRSVHAVHQLPAYRHSQSQCPHRESWGMAILCPIDKWVIKLSTTLPECIRVWDFLFNTISVRWIS